MTNPTQLLGWQDIFKCYPIFDTICAHLEPSDIISLRLTTKQLSPLFETLFRTQWNINRQLTRFIKDPISFRSQLAEHDALISGSFALQFFDRRIWRDSDLDVYVGGQKSPDAVGYYLVKHEGYTLEIAKTVENGGLLEHVERVKLVSQINSYVRRNSSSKEPTRIRIHSTIGIPLHTILHGFCQTYLLNIISREYAYSLMPDLNFIKRTAYKLNGCDDDNDYELTTDGKTVLLEAVCYRGWKWEREGPRDDLRNMHSLQLTGNRRIGDSYTWSIPLDADGVRTGKPSSVLQHSFFKCEHLPSWYSTSTLGTFIVHLKLIKSPVLLYDYTTSIKFYDKFAFWASIESKLKDLEQAELVKFSGDEWLTRYQALGRTYNAFISEVRGRQPAGWTFVDDQVPAWYEEYRESEAQRLRAEKEEAEREQAKKKELGQEEPVFDWGNIGNGTPEF